MTSLQIVKFQPDEVLSLCAVCIGDTGGAKIAVLVIISALILLGVANWAWKKYFQNKKEFSQEK